MSDHEINVRRFARILSEISHTLESSDDRPARVARCLELTRNIIPADRCALLEVHGGITTLYASPLQEDEEHYRLHERLASLFQLVIGGEEIGRSSRARPSLALPVMGLDQIIGVIRVESNDAVYEAMHLRLLSVVAAQLGAYLAMVRLRERDLARTRELETANEFQRLLAGVVGHDLRNPLAVITTVAASLMERATEPEQKRNLERALRNAEHATHLIADLMDVTESRISGVIAVAPEASDYREVVESTVEDLQHAHRTRTIELVIAGDDSLTGVFDPTRIRQVVTNLVVNAMVHGDPDRPIRVKLYEQDGQIVISVRNWGAPIPPALLPTIFDPFKQGAPAARPHNAGGLGLGLYIVDCISRGHGGRVTVASDADGGTVFHVHLPREAGQVPAVAAPRPVSSERAVVLIVDDDEDVRLGLSIMLGKRGYDVATAEHGLDALHQLRAGLRPRAILLDYQMPVMNGEEFCEECARDPALVGIPIVLVSGAAASAVKLARTHGTRLLTKPVPIDRLIETLKSIH